MTDYLNTDWQGAPIPVPPSDRLNLPGVWIPVQFDHDIADPAGHHSGDSPLIGSGAARYLSGVLDLRLQDFASGVEVQIRQYEEENGVRVETHLAREFNTSPVPVPTDENGEPLYPRTTHHRYPVFSKINAGHRLGIEISQWPADLSAPDGLIVQAQLMGTLTP